MCLHRVSSSDDSSAGNQEDEDMTDILEKENYFKQSLSELSSTVVDPLLARINAAVRAMLMDRCYLTREFVSDLTTAKCYILALIQSLSSRDLVLTLALLQTVHKFRSIDTFHIKVWFLEEVCIKKEKLMEALDFVNTLNSSKLLSVPQNVIDMLEFVFAIIEKTTITNDGSLTEQTNQSGAENSERDSECSWELCNEETEAILDDSKLMRSDEKTTKNKTFHAQNSNKAETNNIYDDKTNDRQLLSQNKDNIFKEKQVDISEYIGRVGFLSLGNEQYDANEQLSANQNTETRMAYEKKNPATQHDIQTKQNTASEQLPSIVGESMRDGNTNENKITIPVDRIANYHTNYTAEQETADRSSLFGGLDNIEASSVQESDGRKLVNTPQQTSDIPHAIYVPPKICPVAMPSTYSSSRHPASRPGTFLTVETKANSSSPKVNLSWRKSFGDVEPNKPPIRDDESLVTDTINKEHVDANSCHSCGELFSQIHSKYSCNYCAKVFCDQCTVKITTFSEHSKDFQQACRPCFDKKKQSTKLNYNPRILEKGTSSIAQNRKIEGVSTLKNDFIMQKNNTVPMNRLSRNDKETTLHTAVFNGDLPAVKKCIDTGVDINSKDSKGFTPFHLSIALNRKEICDLLLEYDILIETQNTCGFTPLHSAVSNNNEEVFNKLMICGASVDTEDIDGNTPLHTAIRKGNATIIAALLRYSQINKLNSAGMSPLHIAVDDEHDGIVEMLIEEGAILDAKNNVDWTPLHLAVSKNNELIVKTLLDNGASLNIKNDLELTPFHTAVSKGDIEMAEFLIKYGAEWCTMDKQGQQPLHTAAERNDLEMIKILISAGANVNSRTKDGKTSLHLTAANNLLDATQFLLKLGAAIDVIDNCGRTPFYMAALYDNIWMIKYFQEKGFDIHKKDGEGRTHLHLAAWNGDEKVVKLLLNLGCAVDVKTNSGNTSLHFAAFRGFEKIVKLLIEYGANIKNTNERNLTPHGMALSNKKTNIAELLQSTETTNSSK